VYDDTGDGQTFAYTIGLHDLGLPELHVWARPTHGHDPGADFSLSVKDLALLLNRFGAQLRNGDTTPGDTIVEEVDAGLTEIRYTIGQPGPAADVDAFHVHADATVIPVRWVLCRPEIGEPVHVPPERIAELARRCGLRPAPSTGPHTFGPWGPVIDELRALVEATAPNELFAVAANVLEVRDTLGWIVGVSATAARPAGRVAEHSAAIEAAHSDADLASADPCFDDPEDPDLRGGIANFLGQMLSAVYGGVAVVDALPPDSATLTTELAEMLANPRRSWKRLTAHAGADPVVRRWTRTFLRPDYSPRMEVPASPAELAAGHHARHEALRNGMGSAAWLRLGRGEDDHGGIVGDAICAAVLAAAGLISAGELATASAPARRLFRDQR
jgi:hypothetical protein